jgi:hypothetical protein
MLANEVEDFGRVVHEDFTDFLEGLLVILVEQFVIVLAIEVLLSEGHHAVEFIVV